MTLGCNTMAGHNCLPLNGTYICRPIRIVSSGQCGVVGTEFIQCRGDYWCNVNGTCELRPIAGQACSGVALCRWPEECVGGTCRLPDPAACG